MATLGQFLLDMWNYEKKEEVGKYSKGQNQLLVSLLQVVVVTCNKNMSNWISVMQKAHTVSEMCWNQFCGYRL